MKKITFAALLMMACFCAVSVAAPQIIRKPIVLISHVVPTRPGIKPFSLTEPGQFTFDAMQTEDAILLTSDQAVSNVEVRIENENGIAYMQNVTFFTNQTVEIYTANWPAGIYTLYIEYSSVSLEGEFETYKTILK